VFTIQTDITWHRRDLDTQSRVKSSGAAMFSLPPWFKVYIVMVAP